MWMPLTAKDAIWMSNVMIWKVMWQLCNWKVQLTP